MLLLDSGTYHMTADASCPDTTRAVLPVDVDVLLMSQKAYFILVSGQPLRAKLVSNVFTVDQSC